MDNLIPILSLLASLGALAGVIWIAIKPQQSAQSSPALIELRTKLESLSESVRLLERALRDNAAKDREEQGRGQATFRAELTGALRAAEESRLSEQARRDAAMEQKVDAVRTAVAQSLAQFSQAETLRGETLSKAISKELAAINEGMRASAEARQTEAAIQARTLVETIADLRKAIEESLAGLRASLEKSLADMRGSNEVKLEEMRATVDEKLKGTLETRLGEAFSQVSARLESVHKALGEIQSISTDVGDLRRVMTNVKTRGVFGEYILLALVEQVLTPEQFVKNYQPKKKGPATQESVEVAIRLPGNTADGKPVMLPIDAKFPKEDYERILTATDAADAGGVESARKALEQRILGCAKDIASKYLNPPETTDFGILFLPSEGLYAEALNRPGLCDKLQRELHITLAGPTTLLALLNSLQMGFRTLAIQKKSGEVWTTLQGVKKQVLQFGDILVQVEKKLDEAKNKVGEATHRNNQVQKSLGKVEALPDGGPELPLGLDEQVPPKDGK